MSVSLVAALLWAVLFAATPLAWAQACCNGSFELGDFTCWSGFHGTNTTGPDNIVVNPAPAPSTRLALVSPGFDPVLGGTLLPTSYQGIRVARIGNFANDQGIEQLRYSFTVTTANQQFSFGYAVVLQDPGHPQAQQPFFRYRFIDSAGNTIPGTMFLVFANRNDPYFKVIGDIVYRPWDCAAVDLSAYLGQNVTAEFTAADCSLGAHWGYAYVDAMCTAAGELQPAFNLPAEACPHDTILADGTPSQGETSYFWSVVESDANWNPIGTEVNEWFIGQQAGVLNLTSWYQTKGFNFKCDTYYRVKLAVKNGCIGWKETVKLLKIKPCLGADPGPNKDLCCNSTQGITLGPASAQLGVAYWWTGPNGFTSGSPNPVVQPLGSGWYTLSVESPNACPATAKTYVTVDAPIKVSVDSMPSGVCPCGRLLVAQVFTDATTCRPGTTTVNNSSSGKDYPWKYLWSTGATTQDIKVNPAVPTTYTVTASNACFSGTASVTAPVSPTLTGAFPELIAPNAVVPNSSSPDNRVMKVFQLGLAANASPAYNATDYRFTVFNRWGNNIYQRTNSAMCAGFSNGEILWDATANGQLVPSGVYNWMLELKNCTHPDWTQVKTGQPVTVIRQLAVHN